MPIRENFADYITQMEREITEMVREERTKQHGQTFTNIFTTKAETIEAKWSTKMVTEL